MEDARLVDAPVTELRVALTVPDFDAALAFYRDALGLEQVADWSGETGRVVLLAGGRGTLELLDERQAATIDEIEAGARVSGVVRLAVEVTESDELAKRLADAGAEAVAPPVATPWGDLNARLRTPDGLQLTLFTPAEEPAAREAEVSHVDTAAAWEHDEETGGLVHVLRSGAVEIGLWKPGPVAGKRIEYTLEADETLLVLAGSGSLEVDGGAAITLEPGVLVNLPAGARTRWVVDDAFHELWVYS